MTLSNDTLIIEGEMQDEAIQVINEAGDAAFQTLSITFDSISMPIPKNLSRLLFHVLQCAASGGNITVRTMPEDLTTTVAADFIGVSRPTLMKMIANGEVEAHDVGSHKRLKSRDVLLARAAKLESQRESFEELRSMKF